MLSAPTSPVPVGRPRRQHNAEPIDRLRDNFQPKPVPASVRRAQEWLNIRFASTRPEDFCSGVRFYTAVLLEPPAGLESIWGGTITDQHRAGEEASREERQAIGDASAVLLLANIHDEEQMKRVISMGEFIHDNFREAAPLLVFVPHTVRPELRKPTDLDDLLGLFMDVLNHVVDEAITDEPDGMKLALEVQCKVLVQASLLRKFSDESRTDDNEDAIKRVEFLEDVIHDTVWDYLRVRLHTHIPVMDCNIAPDIPSQIEDYTLGSYLGKGSFGSVYKLQHADGEPSGFVVKAVPKKGMTDLPSLYNLKRQIEVMQILSDDWPHPNITKLQDIYHSETHLLLLLEDCGPVDLYKFYVQCERRQLPLSLPKTQAIIRQLIAAICHMHTKPKVVHGDLKPENIIINEARSTALVKIADFDTARVDPQIPCYGIVGTFPFSAPEMVLAGEYDPYAADVWSLGLVMVELVCFPKVLEKALQLISGSDEHTKRERQQIRRQNMSTVHHFFSHPEAVGCLLQENMRHDLHDLTSRSFTASSRHAGRFS